ncbi:uncharacterized protein LOC117318894 isoform X2 [Pecten maximus]|uniref:uncharacterized protein LOC117318894 isoform X2 n=1 Tax=Pecten maximus TaxID=6579 RepID=UPI0014580EC3|nr:uncharacterized protein LOC117318894 isoform X2 [Pecten maximus]
MVWRLQQFSLIYDCLICIQNYTSNRIKMAAAGLFNKPFFISLEELLPIDCIETFDELCEFYMSEKNTGIDARLMIILCNMIILSNTYMSYDQKRNTRVQIVDFWKSVDQLGLHYMFVQKGVLIYKQPWVQNNCSARFDFHQEMISFENHDALFMENQCFPWNTVVEASDQAQDWISQEMVKPHVRVMKEKLNFTDVQIVNGLQILRERDEEITFMGLLNTLVPMENALLNVYIGTGKFAFSADIKLVLRHCYAKYHSEPTQEEFELEWNRIKEHLMEQVDLEKTRANRTEEEKMRAEEEKMRAEEEKLEALNREAILKKEKDDERAKAEAERANAKAERAKAEMLEKQLAKMTALFEKEKV